jgi:hypothetical protein
VVKEKIDWEADVLPLNYARIYFSIAKRGGRRQGLLEVRGRPMMNRQRDPFLVKARLIAWAIGLAIVALAWIGSHYF